MSIFFLLSAIFRGTSTLVAGLQTDPPGGSGFELPAQSLSCCAALGPEAQQCATGLLSQRQGEPHALTEISTTYDV